jgi:hypothetical protein
VCKRPVPSRRERKKALERRSRYLKNPEDGTLYRLEIELDDKTFSSPLNVLENAYLYLAEPPVGTIDLDEKAKEFHVHKALLKDEVTRFQSDIGKIKIYGAGEIKDALTRILHRGLSQPEGLTSKQYVLVVDEFCCEVERIVKLQDGLWGGKGVNAQLAS